jgi:glycosyltransferase involved in cell wall biosynthesis
VQVIVRPDEGVAVSVLVVTYNHARFVRQALDGALAQRLPHPFEILISEDCSTDGTREIVLEYAERHPQLVRLLLSERNLHSNEVVARGFRAARGRYVALLDGDDYWTSDDKLRAQVAFLDARPDLTICFHNVQVVDERSQSSGRLWNAPGQPEVSGLYELLRGNFIATSSVVYRRAAVAEVPTWYDGFFPVTDWPLHVLYARAGRIGYIDRTLGAYRLHAGGLFSTLGEHEKLEANADFYRRLRAYSSRTLATEVARGQRDYFLGWAEEFRRRGDRRMLLRCLGWAWSGRLGAVPPGRWVLPLAGRAAW